MDVLRLWQELTQTDEHTRLEAKPGREIGNSVMQTVCAYANTEDLNGGYILIGIEEDENSPVKYKITGVSDSDRLQKELVTQCTSKFNVTVRPEISVLPIEGKIIIGVYIPESPATEKPVYMRRQGMNKGTYVRVGSTDQICGEQELVRMLQRKNMRPYDETIIPQTDISDISPGAIAVYRTLRRRKNPHAPELEYSDNDLLYALHCVDKVDGELKPTVAGLLLFGTDAVLRRYFPMVRFDYVRVRGREWGGSVNDRSYYSLELRESLLTLLPKAEAAIMDDMEREYIFPHGSLTREERPVLPYDAVREVLVNAVMHRDYLTANPALVVRFSDRIEFHNPGYSLKPIETMGTPGSEIRNPTIAGVLNETEYAENKGSGIAKVKRRMQEAQLPPPDFSSSKENNSFIVTLSLHQLMDEKAVAWLTQFQDTGLSSEEARVLVYAKNHGHISNESCRELTGYDTAKSSRLLTRLRECGLLNQHSHGPATYYTVHEGDIISDAGGLDTRILLQDTQIGSGTKPAEGLDTQMILQDTQTGSGTKPAEGLDTQMNLQDTMMNETTRLLASLPPGLRNEIQQLGQRMPPEKREEMLIKVCSVRPFTTGELSSLFGNSRHWAKQSVKELVSGNKLFMTLPDKPNSRNQAYYCPEKQQPDNL